MATKKKLTLDKKTVSKLDASELRNIEGGIVTSCTPPNNCCGGDGGGTIKEALTILQY
jgi:hypothetical protein